MENETVNENMSRIKSPLYPTLCVCVNCEQLQRRMMAGFSPKNAESCRSHFCQFDEKSVVEEEEEE